MRVEDPALAGQRDHKQGIHGFQTFIHRIIHMKIYLNLKNSFYSYFPSFFFQNWITDGAGTPSCFWLPT